MVVTMFVTMVELLERGNKYRLLRYCGIVVSWYCNHVVMFTSMLVLVLL